MKLIGYYPNIKNNLSCIFNWLSYNIFTFFRRIFLDITQVNLMMLASYFVSFDLYEIMNTLDSRSFICVQPKMYLFPDLPPLIDSKRIFLKASKLFFFATCSQAILNRPCLTNFSCIIIDVHFQLFFSSILNYDSHQTTKFLQVACLCN